MEKTYEVILKTSSGVEHKYRKVWGLDISDEKFVVIYKTDGSSILFSKHLVDIIYREVE